GGRPRYRQVSGRLLYRLSTGSEIRQALCAPRWPLDHDVLRRIALAQAKEETRLAEPTRTASEPHRLRTGLPTACDSYARSNPVGVRLMPAQSQRQRVAAGDAVD